MLFIVAERAECYEGGGIPVDAKYESPNGIIGENRDVFGKALKNARNIKSAYGISGETVNFRKGPAFEDVKNAPIYNIPKETEGLDKLIDLTKFPKGIGQSTDLLVSNEKAIMQRISSIGEWLERIKPTPKLLAIKIDLLLISTLLEIRRSKLDKLQVAYDKANTILAGQGLNDRQEGFFVSHRLYQIGDNNDLVRTIKRFSDDLKVWHEKAYGKKK